MIKLRQQTESNCNNPSYDADNTLKKVCRQATAITLLILSLAFLSGCSGLIDGPFNHSFENGFFSDLDMVPELLYANNDSGLVTYWDEETQSYRTYNQTTNTHLAKTVFTRDGYEMSSTGIVVASSSLGGARVQIVNTKVRVRSDIMNAELDRLGIKSNMKW